jgi:hypothetical protein
MPSPQMLDTVHCFNTFNTYGFVRPVFRKDYLTLRFPIYITKMYVVLGMVALLLYIHIYIYIYIYILPINR